MADRGLEVTDLDRLLEAIANPRPGSRLAVLAPTIKALIERVKEAERKLVFEHMEATRQAAERQKAEAKLRAAEQLLEKRDKRGYVAGLEAENREVRIRLRVAEEVVEAARHYDNYNGTPRIRTAFQHYDEAVERVKE